MEDNTIAAVAMELNANKHEVAEAKRKMDAVHMAAGLIAEWYPKTAANLYRKGSDAAQAWARIAQDGTASDD